MRRRRRNIRRRRQRRRNKTQIVRAYIYIYRERSDYQCVALYCYYQQVRMKRENNKNTNKQIIVRKQITTLLERKNKKTKTITDTNKKVQHKK